MPSEDGRTWTIGELAKAAGVTVRTLRYYDRLGLLSPSARSPAGHRRYAGTEINRLYRVLSLRSLGFSLASISDMLESGGGAVRRTADRHLAHVERQLALYQDLHDRLVLFVEQLEDSGEVSAEQLIQVLEVMKMTIRLSRIYTRAGDSGETHLGDRTRVPKTDPRIESYGDVDELNSHIGVAIAAGGLSSRDVEWLGRIQNDLYDVGADLCVPMTDVQHRSRLRIGAEYVQWLEEACDAANASLDALPSFVLPGGTPGVAQLHVCRTVCRRAERHALHVGDANPEVIRYLNRLSDLLFIMARAANAGPDRLWEPGGHAAAS
jgi:cob(I)alamin adenosyltransferase